MFRCATTLATIIQNHVHALMRPHLEHCIQIRHKKAMDAVGAGSEVAMEMLRGVEYLCYQHRLRELGLFSTEKAPGVSTNEGERLFRGAGSDGTRQNGFKLEEEIFRLGIRKKLLTVRVMKHWPWVPKEAVDAPCLVFKAGWVRLSTTWPRGSVPAHSRGFGTR